MTASRSVPPPPAWREPLVIGLGNRNRRDDAVGLELADRLEPRLRGKASVVAVDGDGTSLLDLWDGRPWVLVVDAVRSGAPPGSVRRVDLMRTSLPSTVTTTSTHGISLAQALALGRSLAQLPDRLLLFGVEGSDFGAGIGFSEGVSAALGPATEAILTEVLEAVPSGSPGATRETFDA